MAGDVRSSRDVGVRGGRGSRFDAVQKVADVQSRRGAGIGRWRWQLGSQGRRGDFDATGVPGLDPTFVTLVPYRTGAQPKPAVLSQHKLHAVGVSAMNDVVTRNVDRLELDRRRVVGLQRPGRGPGCGHPSPAAWRRKSKS